MTSPLMKPTLVGRDTLHELDQPLKKLAYVSNHWGPLLFTTFPNAVVQGKENSLKFSGQSDWSDHSGE